MWNGRGQGQPDVERCRQTSDEHDRRGAQDTLLEINSTFYQADALFCRIRDTNRLNLTTLMAIREA